MRPQSSVSKSTSHSNCSAYDISDPVVYIGAAVNARLDEFNYAAEYARSQKHGKQSKAARSGEGERDSCKRYKVYYFVAPVGRWRWLLQGPEHGDSHDSSYDDGEGDIEVLAHLTRLIV